MRKKIHDRATLNAHTGGSQVQFDIFFALAILFWSLPHEVFAAAMKHCSNGETFEPTLVLSLALYSFGFIHNFYSRSRGINKQIIWLLWII